MLTKNILFRAQRALCPSMNKTKPKFILNIITDAAGLSAKQTAYQKGTSQEK